MAIAGPHRPRGVVLPCPVEAEDGHRRVADELLDDAALGLDDRADGREVAAHDLLQVLRVQPLRQRGGVDEVGEQDGDELELLADGRGQHAVALLDQRGQRGLDTASPRTAR